MEKFTNAIGSIGRYSNSDRRYKSNNSLLDTTFMYKMEIDLTKVKFEDIEDERIVTEDGIKFFDKNGADISENYTDGANDKEFLNDFRNAFSKLFTKTKGLNTLPEFKIYLSRAEGIGGLNIPGQYIFITTEPKNLIDRSQASTFAKVSKGLPDSDELSMSVKGKDPINNLVIDVSAALSSIIFDDKEIESNIYGNSDKPALDNILGRIKKPTSSESTSFVDLTKPSNNNNDRGR